MNTPRNDVAKCNGTDCPIREQCLRFTRPVGDFQWYAAFEQTEGGRTTECEGYKEVDDE